MLARAATLDLPDQTADATKTAFLHEAMQGLRERFPGAFSSTPKTTDAIPTGLAAIDIHAGGIPRGALTELTGTASSGRTSIALTLLRELTANGELCAVVDATDSFSPHTAHAAGVDLRHVLWVRCTESGTRRAPYDRVAQALKAADLILHGGGFGLLLLDLGDVAPSVARKVPLASWFRLRRLVEHTRTAVVLIDAEPCAGTCASLALALHTVIPSWDGDATGPSHTRLLSAVEVTATATKTAGGARKPIRHTRNASSLPYRWGVAG